MVDLNGHEAGNGGHSQGTPKASRPLCYSEASLTGWLFPLYAADSVVAILTCSSHTM